MGSLVSILMPAYNAEKWIGDALRSALGQTWMDKEIIVVDDGSRDQTLSVARGFESRSVKVVTQANQGASAARNAALQLAQGDFIQWLDADDVLALDKISRQMDMVEERESSRTLLSSAWGSFMYRTSRVRFSPTPLWFDLSPVEWLSRKMGQNLHMQTATWLVSRELTEAAGPWDTRLSLDDDGEYFCRVLLASSGVHFVQDAKVLHRASGFSSLSSVDGSNKKFESQFLSIQLHMTYLRSLEESERVRIACLKFLQTWFGLFFDERPDLARKLERMALDLGGKLEVPRLREKYRWIEQVGGRQLGRRAQFFLPRAKWNLLRAWDRALLGVEQRQIGN